MKTPLRIAVAGLGTVGAGVLKVLETHADLLETRCGRRIVVTHGSQEGMFLTAQLLLRTGDKVAIDELGFQPAWDAFRAAGADLSPVRLDANGMVPEALEDDDEEDESSEEESSVRIS